MCGGIKIPSIAASQRIDDGKCVLATHSRRCTGFREFISEFAESKLDAPVTYCIIGLIQLNRESRLLPQRNSTVQIHISANDGIPIYLQIVNQIKYLVASGRLAPGEELLPMRVLAQQLLINPNTVARAYRELETAGVVEKRRTAGTYVTDQKSPLARGERIKIISERLDALLAEARQLDISLEEVVKLAQQRHAALQLDSQ